MYVLRSVHRLLHFNNIMFTLIIIYIIIILMVNILYMYTYLCTEPVCIIES